MRERKETPRYVPSTFQQFSIATFEIDSKGGKISFFRHLPQRIITNSKSPIHLTSFLLRLPAGFAAIVSARATHHFLPPPSLSQVHKLSGWKYWGNITIAVFYIAVGVCGAVGAIRCFVRLFFKHPHTFV